MIDHVPTNSVDIDSRLDELLQRWEEIHRHGETCSPEELCSTCPELVGELAHRIALLRAFDPFLSDTTMPPAAHPGPGPAIAPSRGPATARAEYRDLRFHAVGGLGEVFTARNAELNREVALKFLKRSRAGDPESRRRFLQEAEVTSRLEHPGVVPIYTLGTDGSGAPCYAMRFIRGKTLQDAIDSFHAAEILRREGAERSLALRELLNRFVSICSTIAYAHSRGILHRDLKPGNVMLGKYEETLVVDWGLAKPFEREDEAVGTGEEALTPSSGSGSPTLGVIGTLAYMSPEQAQARASDMGPASDLFSLGAILYAILTGAVPYRGGLYGELLEKVKHCCFPAPRQIKPEVPRALEAICLKAMAKRPVDRYATALELAADVKRWLADEPVAAYSEPLAARVRRWVRRHQRLLTAATVTALVTTAASLLIAAVISASNLHLAAANETIRQKNHEITRQNQELEKSNQSLAEARNEAEAQRDQAQQVTEFLVSSFRKPDPAQDGRTVTVAEVIGRAVKELEGRPKMVPATRAAILNAVGETYRSLGFVTENVAIYENILTIRRQQMGDDDLLTLSSMNNLAAAYDEAGQLDRAIPLKEKVLVGRRAKLGEGHPDTLNAMNNLAMTHMKAGQLDRAIAVLKQVLEGLRFKLGEGHPDTLTAMNNLAVAYEQAGQLDRAIALHEQVLNVVRVKLGEGHPDTLLSMNNLAAAYDEAGQLDRAIPLKEKVLEGRRAKLGEDHPDTLFAMSNLAVAHVKMGQLDRAIPLFERVLEGRRVKLGEGHPDTLTSMNNLAVAYNEAGQLNRAIALHEQALTGLRVKFGEGHPGTLNSVGNLAVAYRDSGRLDRAIPLLEQTMKAQQAKLGEDHPSTLKTLRNLAQAYQGARRYLDAESLFHRVVEATGRQKPRNDRLYSDSLALLGHCVILERNYAAAVSPLRECVKLKEKSQPDAWETANARSLLGEAAAGQNSFGEAEPLLLVGQQELAERRQKIPAVRRDVTLRQAAERLVQLYEAWNKPVEAERWKKQLSPPPATRTEEAGNARAAAAPSPGR